MTKAYFQEHFSPLLPNTPGIYKYFNKDKKIIYVGKAIDLKKRVSSYFLKNDHNAKTVALVKEINNIEYTVTKNEHDAFLLENSLIKHFRPFYNIALKDDKAYPFVVIKNEDFPRVFLTRNYIQDGSEYIGPFTNVYAVRQLLDLIRKNIPLRNCNLALTPQNIAKKKFKVCLEYHLGNCLGPCEGKQSLEDYTQSIKTVKSILKGNLGQIIRDLKQEQEGYISQLEFEKAAQIQNQIIAFNNYESQSNVVSSTIKNIDAATIIDTENYAYINYLLVRNGLVLNAHSISIEKKLDESEKDTLSYAISVLRPLLNTDSNEILVPFEVNLEDTNIIQTIPITGDKRKVLDMSFNNAKFQKQEHEKKRRLLLNDKTDNHRGKILEEIRDYLHLKKKPTHIECFDNSNFQGAFPVAAMVCFKDGLPYKKEYRHFHIKTVTGINDFASMEEIVYRRYKAVLEEGKPLPDLVIIDGGKGQLSAAMKSVHKLGLSNKMAVVGLAKREELIYFPQDSEPIQIPYNSQALLFIRSVRDEVHRFGITFHRKTRSKGTIKNELEDIKGIGKKIAENLLLTYRSVANIKKQTEVELSKTIGKGKAKIVWNYFNTEHSKNEATTTDEGADKVD